MAEQVNQRIEDMINELEQMRRTELYDEEEIKEISRKRKEFEYHIQRRVKQKEDFTQYIAYELTLLEDISIRRKKNKLIEKKKDIEYAIAKRLNKVFKQFIYRFQDDIEIYFEYIKFCRSVGFDYAISGIIGQMLQLKRKLPQPTISSPRPITSDLNEFLILHDSPRKKKLKREIEQLRWKARKDGLKIRTLQMKVKRLKKKIHGDKPKIWQMASKWESKEQNNLDNARNFLLKGIQRHPDSEVLYVELFDIELIALTFKTESDDERVKQVKRADIVWRNGAKSISKVGFLFKIFDLCRKYEIKESFINDIKQEIWSRKHEKDVWSYVAFKELEGCHWEEIEEFEIQDTNYSKEFNYFNSVYLQALDEFPGDKKLCTRYIHELLGVGENVCTNLQKIQAVKRAWMHGHVKGMLSNDMYAFGIKMYKLEDGMAIEKLIQMLESSLKTSPLCIWEEKLLLNKSNEDKMLNVLQEAVKVLKVDDLLQLYNLALDNVKTDVTLKTLHKQFQNCEHAVLLVIKPKLLKKMYEHNGIKAARLLYEDLIRTPPTQIEVHTQMIDIELEQESPNLKSIRKVYECAVQHHGTDNVDIWMKYMLFETEHYAQAAPTIYRRAVGMLKKELVDEFIRAQTLAKIK